ncbi:MAG: fibronectin type III domain-containing protein, partial [Acidobacteriota bacterium]
SASPAGVGTVNLSWVDNATNETQYLVERSLNGGGFGQIGALSANARSFQDSDAPSASSASYRVRARNGAGFSDYSNVAAVQVPGAPPPRDLAVSILSATEARLTWTDVTTGETGFEVEASAFGAFVPAAVTGPDATEVTLSGLQPDTLYQFRVRAAGAPQGDSTFVTVSGRTFPGSPEACVEDATTFCLNEGRFRVQVSWRDFEDRTGPGSRVPIPATDSGVFWFFGADNWEMLVKVLDGCAITNHFWVFAAATTNVEFTLVVTDTVTGATSVHRNELGESAPAIVDTEALPVCSAGASAPPSETSQSEVSQSEVSQSEVSQPEAFEFEMPQSEVSQSETSQSEAPRVRVVSTSDPSIQLSGSAPQLDELLKMDCTESETATCLNQERFQVRGSWRDFGDNTGEARVVDLPVVSDESGLLWFFSPDNWEVLIKVLNGCPITNHYWVFAAATTNVEYRIEVTDTTTDDVVVYTNALGNVASAITDTEAFATCP